MLSGFEKTILVTGHYGSGKTNLSLNLAVDFRRRGDEVVLADLDIVNPYFRSAEYTDLARENGITLVASEYAGPRTSLDIPALTGRLDARIGGGATLIIDVGGDDAGAVALGRYAARISEAGYTMLYVVNAYRYLVRDPGESLALLREIEAVSRLRATHIANNSNLGAETTLREVRIGVEYAKRVSEASGLPICFTSVNRALAGGIDTIQDLYPVEIYVSAPWN